MHNATLKIRGDGIRLPKIPAMSPVEKAA